MERAQPAAGDGPAVVAEDWRAPHPPAVLAKGVDRAHVEAEWNHPPWREPPAWWGEFGPPWADGLTWPEYLVRTWRLLLLTPPTPEQRRHREMVERAGRALAVEMTEMALEVLGYHDGLRE